MNMAPEITITRETDASHRTVFVAACVYDEQFFKLQFRPKLLSPTFNYDDYFRFRMMAHIAEYRRNMWKLPAGTKH